MGRKELALALQQKGEAEAKAIWQQAEAEVDHYQQQRQQEVARQATHSGRQADQSALQACHQVDWQVTRKVRALRLKSLSELDRRLWQIVCEELDRLEPEQRRQSLGRLVVEMPEADWQSLNVHPDDAKKAKEMFPGCRIETNAEIGGGLVAEFNEGKVRVDNSLKKRLESSWTILVGRMLAELEQGVGDDND